MGISRLARSVFRLCELSTLLAFLALSSHSLDGKLAFLFDPVGLAVLGVATLVIGTVGFAVGYLGRSSIERLREKVVSQQSRD